MRLSLPTLAALALATATVAGCGTTSVSMVVVRPAVLNAQPYGGTVSVAGFVAPTPDHAVVAGRLREEVATEVAAGYGGVVRLTPYGGGLNITGRLDDYTMRLREVTRMVDCKKKKVVEPAKGADGEEAEEKKVITVKARCKRRQIHWRARVMALVRIQASNGQLLYLRQLVERRSGSTAELQDRVPRPPNPHRVLRRLRRKLARRIGRLVVPHRVRMTAMMYDCKGPAEELCDRGARLLASSRYDEALATYGEALTVLAGTRTARKSDAAKIHWNRAQVCRYARRFDMAHAELQKARALDPRKRRYRRELAVIAKARQDHHRLIDQGLVPRNPGGAPR